jgi:hypothetical protein
VAQEDDTSGVRLGLFGCESASHDRVDAEQVKEVPGDCGALHPLGLTGAIGDRQGASGAGGNGREGRGGLLPVAHVEERRAAPVARFQLLFVEHHDPIGVGVRIRLEDHAVDDAEDGGVEADAEAETENGDRREALAVPERAESVAEVAEHALD